MNKHFLFILIVLSFSCIKNLPDSAVKLVKSEDVKFDKDQILICPYILKYNTLRCMSPEEFEVRSHIEE